MWLTSIMINLSIWEQSHPNEKPLFKQNVGEQNLISASQELKKIQGTASDKSEESRIMNRDTARIRMQCARLLHKVLKCAAKFTAGSHSHNICRALEAEKTFPPSLLSPTCPAPSRLTSAPVAAVPLRVDGFSSHRDARAATPLPLTLRPRGARIYICTAAQSSVLQASSQIHAALKHKNSLSDFSRVSRDQGLLAWWKFMHVKKKCRSWFCFNTQPFNWFECRQCKSFFFLLQF